jgi:hypothetical protein
MAGDSDETFVTPENISPWSLNIAMRTRQLLSKLPLNRRMWLAVGLLTLPVMAALYFVVSALQKDINFAARERAGVAEAFSSSTRIWMRIT